MEKKRAVRLPAWAVVMAIAALCALAYMLAQGIVSTRELALSTAIPIPALAEYPMEPLGDGLVFYDGETLHAMDGKGRQIWSHSAGSMASFHVGANTIATWRGTMLSLIDRRTGELTTSTNVSQSDAGAIIEAKPGETYVATQTEGDAATAAERQRNTVMYIYDPGARQIDRYVIEKQTVIDFGFFRNDQLFWTLGLSTEGTEPVCLISSYRLGRNMINGFFYDTEQTTYKALFQSSKIRTIGLKYIKDFDYRGKEDESSRILVYGWYMVALDETGLTPTMLFVPVGQADGMASVTDVRIIADRQDTALALPIPAEQVMIKDGVFYGFSSGAVMIREPGEQIPRTYRLPMEIDRVVGLTDNHSAIVVRGSGVFLIPLRD